LHVALRIAYDGAAFPRGYQRQPGGGTVEDALIEALRAGYVAGSWRTGSRTDRGVSAAENVAACALDRPHVRGLVPSVCSALPDGVWLTGAAIVPATWNPRHAASRTYAYFAPDHGEDAAALGAAAAAFVGRHDMRAFARLDGGRDPVREVTVFDVARIAGGWRFTVSGPSFLWNQVRRMVDAVQRVGGGDATVADIGAALATGRPHRSFKVARAEGLLLSGVDYDERIVWGGAAGATRIDRFAQRAQVMHELAARLRERA
jgi:tRNA pseudouridine38-40 synthase